MKYTEEEKIKIIQHVDDMIERSKKSPDWNDGLEKTWNSFRARVARNIGLDETRTHTIPEQV